MQPLTILSAVNESLLIIFLLANILTGVANLTLDTKSLSPAAALALLSVYMLVLCTAALALQLPKQPFTWYNLKGTVPAAAHDHASVQRTCT